MGTINDVSEVPVHDQTTPELENNYESSYHNDPAPVRNPLMKGLYFPKATDADLAFDVDVVSDKDFMIEVERMNDYSHRQLKVLEDGVVKETYDLNPGQYVYIFRYTTSSYSVDKITLRIHDGSRSSTGWILRHFYGETNSLVRGVFFPKAYRSELAFAIEAGTDTQLDIKIDSVNDGGLRYFSVYVDGSTKVPESYSYRLPWSSKKTFDIGDYSWSSSHTMKLRIRSGSQALYGWKLQLLPDTDTLLRTKKDGMRVHHLGRAYEVDYMDGHYVSSSYFEYPAEYYKNHGFKRVEFHIDDKISHDKIIEPWEIAPRKNNNFDHNGQEGWAWIMICHYWIDKSVAGHVPIGSAIILIFEQRIDDFSSSSNYAANMRGAIMHEVGHQNNVNWLLENYCQADNCAMGTLGHGGEYPIFCTKHWGEHKFR
jgi:hypothetical protein